jgi:hypothetical protein
MGTSRRELLRKGVLAGAAALLPVPEILAAVAGPRTRRNARVANTLPWLSRPLFESHLNELFQVYTPDHGWIRTRLTRVEDITAAAAAGLVGSPDCFTAVFENQSGADVGQGTYHVHNRGTGMFTLFLVPGGQSGRTRFSLATINRAQG